MWHFNMPPVAASRPRIGKWGAYYSGPYQEFRETAEDVVPLTIGSEYVPLTGELAVVVEIYAEKPKTTKLSKPKPDIDNYVKAVFDVLNKRLWEDDSQITSLYVTKQWSDSAGYFTVEVNNGK